MKENRCPFLESKTVTYCKAFPVKKMIPEDASSREPGLCRSANFRECGAYREIDVRGQEGESIRGFRLHPGCWFHPRHLWVAPAGEDGEARIGMDDFAQKLLGPVHRVSVPPEGSHVSENSVMVLVHSGKRTLRMIAPGDGIVRTVNRNVETDPGLINRDPYREGWILSLLMAGDGISRLYQGPVAKKWLEWEVERLQRMFTQELGLTATDGGESLPDISGKLNDAQWSRIVTLFLG